MARFEVPDVPAGWYHVEYCNDPCTVDGIGDLIGSQEFAIAASRLEAQHIRQVDRLENRISSIRRKVHAHARVEQRKLERALEARTAELGEADARIATLETKLANRPPEQASEDGTLVPGWAVVVLALAIGGATVAMLRRRRLVFVVPDTIPDHLDDLEERAPVLPR